MRGKVSHDQLYSPRQVARAIGVSESSVKRWCDQGMVSMVKTAGGHRRIPGHEVFRICRESGEVLPEPSLLDLPSMSIRGAETLEGAVQSFTDALVQEDESLGRAIVFEFYLRGYSLYCIFDTLIAPSFRKLGEMWECQDLDVFEERRCCQIVLRILHEIRTKLPPPNAQRLAIGGTLEGDHYALPVTMCELVLRSANWATQLLGTSIPHDSMIRAIEKYRPALFWVSVSFIADESYFIKTWNEISDVASQAGTALIVGGRELNQIDRTQLRYTAYCDTMQNLDSLARSLQHQPVVGPSK